MARRHSLQDASGFISDDGDNRGLIVAGTTLPTDGTAGYAVGCLFMLINGTTGGLLFENTGSTTSCAFRPLGSTYGFVAAGSTLTPTVAQFGKLIKLDTLTGSVVTLPTATGSGGVYTFVVSVVPTSNSHVVQCAGSDKLQGYVFTMSDDAGAPVKGYFAVAGTSVSVTLNRSTTGGVTIGETITVTDFAANRWHVQGFTSSTGTEATPFA